MQNSSVNSPISGAAADGRQSPAADAAPVIGAIARTGPQKPARRPAAGTASARPRPDIGPLRARHLALAERLVDGGGRRVTIDEAESPLVWLARRRGRDGRPLIEPYQVQAGERLRAEFTRGQMMPRTTANWSSTAATKRRSVANTPEVVTETALAARQNVNAALKAVGPEFSGLLLDLCCFLKGLEDIERSRGWPARSAKVVLQLALDRLARHYGYLAEARGKPHARLRTWLAEDAAFHVE